MKKHSTDLMHFHFCSNESFCWMKKEIIETIRRLLKNSAKQEGKQ